MILYHIPSVTAVGHLARADRAAAGGLPRRGDGHQGLLRQRRQHRRRCSTSMATSPSSSATSGSSPRRVRNGAQGTICGVANFAPSLLRPIAHEGKDDDRVITAIVDAPGRAARGPGREGARRPSPGRSRLAAHARAARRRCPRRRPQQLGAACRPDHGSAGGLIRETGRADEPTAPGDDREAPKLRERAYDAFTAASPGARHPARPVRLAARARRADRAAARRDPRADPALEAEGLIRTVPQRGMQIAHIDLHADPRCLPVPAVHGEGGGRAVHA